MRFDYSSATHRCFLSLCFLSICSAECVYPKPRGTETVSLDELEGNNSTVFTAIRLKLHSGKKDASGTIYLVPPSINSTCVWPLNRTRALEHSQTLTDDFDPLNLHLPLVANLWSLSPDRFVLVLRLSNWDPGNPGLGKQLILCAIPGFPSISPVMSNYEAFCKPEFGRFRTDSRRSIPRLDVLAPISTTLFVRLIQLGSFGLENDQQMPTLIVSVGYRLPPLESRCPRGLFACSSLSERLHELPQSNITWEQRICLPLSLLCDGVVNCPGGSNTDEANCNRTLIRPSIRFDHINQTDLDNEDELWRKYSSMFRSRNPTKFAQLSVIIFILLLISVVMAFSIVVHKCRKSKISINVCCCETRRHRSIVSHTSPKTNHDWQFDRISLTSYNASGH